MRTTETQDFAGLVTLRGAEHAPAGASWRHDHARAAAHGAHRRLFWFDVLAEGLLLVSEHVEAPGVIGQMGTLLGDAGINISFVQVGRQARGGRGLMVTGIDDARAPRGAASAS